MIAFILAGAAFLTVAMGFTGIPKLLAQWIGSLELSHYALLAALSVFFVVLGCFLDGISVVVLTTSVIMPLVEQAGIDPLWFGIYIVIVVETGVTTGDTIAETTVKITVTVVTDRVAGAHGVSDREIGDANPLAAPTCGIQVTTASGHTTDRLTVRVDIAIETVRRLSRVLG